MSSTPSITDPTTWALDREIVLVRVLDATREAVFAAWTDADAFCQWFGPDGFTCTVREMDVRPGGGGGYGASTCFPETAPCSRTASTTSKSFQSSGWCWITGPTPTMTRHASE